MDVSVAGGVAVMRVSLNEIETTIQKAARAAGLPHGLAGDAGRCGAWLAGRGLAGVESCAAALQRIDDGGPGTPAAVVFERRGDDFLAPGEVSALWLGPAAVDQLLASRAHRRGCRIVADCVDEALICLACAALAAEENGGCLTLAWGEDSAIRAHCRRERVDLAGDPRARTPGPLVMEWAEAVAAFSADRNDPPDLPDLPDLADRLRDALERGVAVDADLWESLNVLAARMLVSASETSRLTGAGAGLIDND